MIKVGDKFADPDDGKDCEVKYIRDGMVTVRRPDGSDEIWQLDMLNDEIKRQRQAQSGKGN